MKLYRYLLIISFLVFSSHGIVLPEKWKPCKISPSLDMKRNKCLEKGLSEAIKDLTKGPIKDLNIDGMEPFKINRMSIGQENERSPVRLSMKFKNMDISGFTNFQLTSLRTRVSNPKNWTMVLEGYMPEMIMRSDYTVNGNVLILPITGVGKCNITYEKVRAKVTMSGVSENIDGNEYLRVKDQQLNLEINRLVLYLENLFNGNKLLGDDMNRVLNENWEVLYQELRPSMERGLIKHISRYAKKILEKVEYRKLFLVES